MQGEKRAAPLKDTQGSFPITYHYWKRLTVCLSKVYTYSSDDIHFSDQNKQLEVAVGRSLLPSPAFSKQRYRRISKVKYGLMLKVWCSFCAARSFVLVGLPFQQSSQQPGDQPHFPRPASGRPHSPPQPFGRVKTCGNISEHMLKNCQANEALDLFWLDYHGLSITAYCTTDCMHGLQM